MDQRVDGLLAAREVALRGFLEAGQVRVGEFEKGLVVVPQGVGGEGLEGVGKFRARVVEQAPLFGVRAAFGIHERFQFGDLRLERAVFLLGDAQEAFGFRQPGAEALGGGAAFGEVAHLGGVAGFDFRAQAHGGEFASLPQGQPAEDRAQAHQPRADTQADEKIGGEKRVHACRP